MGYIKSTQEHLINSTDVFESIERHLGIEYADEIKRVLYMDRSKVVPIEVHEETLKEWEDDRKDQERYIDGMSTTITSTYNYLGEVMSFIRNEKRLDRKKLINMLKELETDLGNFC